MLEAGLGCPIFDSCVTASRLHRPRTFRGPGGRIRLPKEPSGLSRLLGDQVYACYRRCGANLPPSGTGRCTSYPRRKFETTQADNGIAASQESADALSALASRLGG